MTSEAKTPSLTLPPTGRGRRGWRRLAPFAAVFGVIIGAAQVLAEASGPNKCACQDQGTVDGFHALTLLTRDRNWEEKWKTPPEEAVRFNTVGSIRLGQTAILLAFFANPMVVDGAAEIECDLRVLKPDGTLTELPPSACYSSKVQGPLEHIRLAGLRVEIEVEPSDPSGVWVFQVGVRDVLRDVRVPLEVSLVVDSSAESGN